MAAADQSVQSDARRMGLGGLEKELHASFQGSRLPTRQKNEHELVSSRRRAGTPARDEARSG